MLVTRLASPSLAVARARPTERRDDPHKLPAAGILHAKVKR